MPRRGSSKPPAEPVVKPYGCDLTNPMPLKDNAILTAPIKTGITPNFFITESRILTKEVSPSINPCKKFFFKKVCDKDWNDAFNTLTFASRHYFTTL